MLNVIVTINKKLSTVKFTIINGSEKQYFCDTMTDDYIGMLLDSFIYDYTNQYDIPITLTKCFE